MKSLNSAACLFFALSLAKIALVTLHTPLIAYANNWDFARAESCLGLWQQYPDRKEYEANPERPVNNLNYSGHRSPGDCIRSSDLLISQFALLPHRLSDRVDFHEIAIVRLLLLAAFTILVIQCLEDPLHKSAVSLIVLLLFGDIAVSSYMNTLYSDFSSIFGIAFSIILISFAGGRQRLSLSCIAALSFALAWLAFSKEQYLYLACVFAICLLLIRSVERKSFRTAEILGLLAILVYVPLGYKALNNNWMAHHMHNANNAHVVFQVILPNARDQDAALEIMNLPPLCKALSGRTLFGDIQDIPECREVVQVTRLQVLNVILHDPRILFKSLATALRDPGRIYTNGADHMYLNYLGTVEDQSVRQGSVYRLERVTSLSTLFDMLPRRLYGFSLCGFIVAGVLAVAGMAASWRKPRPDGQWLIMLALGSVTIVYTLVSTVLGDGYWEFSKHAIGFEAGIVCQSVAAIMLIVRRMPRFRT